MASHILFTLSLMFLSSFFTLTQQNFSQKYPSSKITHKLEKTSHLHFYFHDILSGKNPTAIAVVGRRTAFGSIAIVDDPLTEGHEPGSKVVGRAQGMYAISSKDAASLLMAMDFMFLVGEYNGSSLSVLGRNPFLESVREMPIVGGSGVFRFARGYALAKTQRFDIGTGNAVVEYNVYVMHH